MGYHRCGHDMQKAFKADPWELPYEPTEEEIKKFKLWKCSKCGRWYSLLSERKSNET